MSKDDDVAEFVVSDRGSGFDTNKLKGKKLSDDQARTFATMELSEALHDISASIYELAQSIKKSNL